MSEFCIECDDEATFIKATYICIDEDYPDDPIYSCEKHKCSLCEALPS